MEVAPHPCLYGCPLQVVRCLLVFPWENYRANLKNRAVGSQMAIPVGMMLLHFRHWGIQRNIPSVHAVQAPLSLAVHPSLPFLMTTDHCINMGAVCRCRLVRILLQTARLGVHLPLHRVANVGLNASTSGTDAPVQGPGIPIGLFENCRPMV